MLSARKWRKYIKRGLGGGGRGRMNFWDSHGIYLHRSGSELFLFLWLSILDPLPYPKLFPALLFSSFDTLTLHDAPSPSTLFSLSTFHWLQCCLFASFCADPWVLTLLADLYCCGLASFFIPSPFSVFHSSLMLNLSQLNDSLFFF